MDYKEKLEEARKLYQTANTDQRYVLESLFPKLKESEDERIRKALIKYFSEGMEYLSLIPYNKEQCISWLEKQDKQKLIINGIQTATNYDKMFQNCNVHKFNIGDWVVDKNGTVQQILSYKNGIYKHTNGYSSKMFEDEWRLWDITKDAKDGDILVVERDKTPFIFKGFDKFHPECPIAYCGLDDNGIFIVNSGDGWWTNEKVEPATKEQCNFLFQKMKESGYEWDGEKKELKIIDWSKHIKYEPNGPSIIGQKQVIDYPDSLSKDNWELVHEFVEKFGRIPEDEDELNVLVEYVLKRQKSTWGEEDEKMFRNLHNLIYVVQDCDCDANEKKELSDWIESLKGRYQSKQEWSEEDESIMEAIVEGLKAMQSSFHFISSVKLDSAIDWLKSLRPQNNWKPSDEQIEALKDVREGVFRFGILESLYNDLKKLKGE